MLIRLKSNSKISKVIVIFIFFLLILSNFSLQAYSPKVLSLNSTFNCLIKGNFLDLKVTISEKQFNLPLMKGLVLDLKNPLNLKFYFDSMDKKNIAQDDLDRMIRYFLGFLSTPQDKLWVNLSPYESNRIIPNQLAKLDIGKDLLLEDYILKQITTSLTDPKTSYGKKFWDKVYQVVLKLTKTTNLPIETFYKVWIVPDSLKIWEYKSLENQVIKKNNRENIVAFVKEARLKVMLEDDYFAIQNLPAGKVGNHSAKREYTFDKKYRCKKECNKKIKEIFKKEILPLIEEEVNAGASFAPLRQMYYVLILATYFKQKLSKDSLYSHYIDKENTTALNQHDPKIKDFIYTAYVKSFKQGQINCLVKDSVGVKNTFKTRRYFSGGTAFMSMDTSVTKGIESVSAQQEPEIQGRCLVADYNVDTQEKGLDSLIRQLEKKEPIKEQTLNAIVNFGPSAQKAIPGLIDKLKTISYEEKLLRRPLITTINKIISPETQVNIAGGAIGHWQVNSLEVIKAPKPGQLGKLKISLEGINKNKKIGELKAELDVSLVEENNPRIQDVREELIKRENNARLKGLPKREDKLLKAIQRHLLRTVRDNNFFLIEDTENNRDFLAKAEKFEGCGIGKVILLRHKVFLERTDKVFHEGVESYFARNSKMRKNLPKGLSVHKYVRGLGKNARQNPQLMTEEDKLLVQGKGLEDYLFDYEKVSYPKISDVVKNYHIVFIHGISLGLGGPSSNSLLEEDVGYFTKLKIILSLSPSLSVSTIKKGMKHHTHFWSPLGVILKEGHIFEAYSASGPGGGGTGVVNLKHRTRNYNQATSKHPKCFDEKKIKTLAQAPIDRIGLDEWVIDEPQIAGLYICLDNLEAKWPRHLTAIPSILKIVQELAMPFYVIKEGIVYQADYDFKDSKIILGKQVEPEELLNSKFELGQNKKDEFIGEILEKPPFKLKRFIPESYYFININVGRRAYLELVDKKNLEKSGLKEIIYKQKIYKGGIFPSYEERINKARLVANLIEFGIEEKYLMIDGQLYRDMISRANWQTSYLIEKPEITSHIITKAGMGIFSCKINTLEGYLLALEKIINDTREQYNRLMVEQQKDQAKNLELDLFYFAFLLYGFGQQAGDLNDTNIQMKSFELASNILSKEKYLEFIKLRLTSNGDFKMILEDLVKTDKIKVASEEKKEEFTKGGIDLNLKSLMPIEQEILLASKPTQNIISIELGLKLKSMKAVTIKFMADFLK